MRRTIPLFLAALLVLVLVPAAGAHGSTLHITTTKAPVAPDGTTAGEITDFVLTFLDGDPAVDGIGMLTGGTLEVTLPDGFVNTGVGGPNFAILLQGWPQSPPAPPPAFLWTTSIAGNTITATMTADFPVGLYGPGMKQVHLLLNAFRNPGPGMYDIGLSIRPDPGSLQTYEGVGTVQIVPSARPSVNVVSVFTPPFGPPPFANALYQSVAAGDDAADVGLYLWDGGSSVANGVVYPFLGVDLEMENPGHGRLIQAGKTVGHVWIDAPAGADEFGLATDGPSTQGVSAITALDVGILITRFSTDPDVTGDYTITIRLNNGNTQQLFVAAH